MRPVLLDPELDLEALMRRPGWTPRGGASSRGRCSDSEGGWELSDWRSPCRRHDSGKDGDGHRPLYVETTRRES